MTPDPPQPAAAVVEPADPEPKEAPAPGNRSRRLLVEWGLIIAIALVVAVVVRVFVFQTFFIPSTSMYPTLHPGDRIVVLKLERTPSPGQIVVFRRPPAEDCGGPVVPDLVKRVIGLPGQVIEGRDGVVFINGKRLAEPWLPKVRTTYTANFGPLKIPADHYFMMGDNRVDSCDSRDWGPLPASYIVGKVVMRIWPLGRITFF